MRYPLSFVLVVVTWLVASCSTPVPGGGGGDAGGGDAAASIPLPIWVTHDVRVNTVGYTTGHAKVATVVLPDGMTTVSDDTAEVFDENGNLQWACQLTGPFTDEALNATYYFADFSSFDDPGTFYLEVPALGSDETAQSAPFQIGPDVLAGALTSAMTGMYGQRCGTAVKITMGGDTWQHGACHQHDADSLKYLTGDDEPFSSVGWKCSQAASSIPALKAPLFTYLP